MHSLVLQFFVGQILRFIVKPNRKWNKKSHLPGAFLSMIVLGLFAFMTISVPSNLYHEMGIPSKSSKPLIQAAYRRLSRVVHPDVSTAPNAPEEFRRLNQAHEILTKKRGIYHRFGDYTKMQESLKELPVEQVLLLGLLRLAMDFLIMYLLFPVADPFFLGYQIASFSLELLIRFSPQSEKIFDHIPVFNSFLPFEQIKIIHAVGFAFLNANMVLSSFSRSNPSHPEHCLARENRDHMVAVLLKFQLETIRVLGQPLSENLRRRRRQAIDAESEILKADEAFSQAVAIEHLPEEMKLAASTFLSSLKEAGPDWSEKQNEESLDLLRELFRFETEERQRAQRGAFVRMMLHFGWSWFAS